MYKLLSEKVALDSLRPVKPQVDLDLEGPFYEAGKPVDGKTRHQSPCHPRQEGSREGAKPELRPA